MVTVVYTVGWCLPLLQLCQIKSGEVIRAKDQIGGMYTGLSLVLSGDRNKTSLEISSLIQMD